MGLNCLDGQQSDMSSLTTTVKKSSRRGSKIASLTKPQSSAISEHSSLKGTPQAIQEWLMSSRQVSPASRSVLQENSRERTTPAICGHKLSSVFASYDHASHSWRTSQASLLTLTLDEFSETWPKAGMMQDGVCYQQPKWEPRINEIGSSLWPTPRNTEIDRSKTALGVNGFNIIAADGREWGANLATAVQMWPTPRAGKTSDENEDTWMKRQQEGKVSTPPLSLAVKMYPTPTCDDADNSTLPPSQWERNNLPGHLLRSGEIPGGQRAFLFWANIPKKDWIPA